MWLVGVATGELADAIDRDLFSDHRDFDELGWRGLWAYITKAPPRTAIFHDLSAGIGAGDEFTLEVLNELREFNWRYTAVNFKNGADRPAPERITRDSLKPGGKKAADPLTLEELIPPHVRALLQGG